MSSPPRYDVAIIGAGVVGAAIARALVQHRLEVVLLEAGDDVGAGISKANTAILHTGFDTKPGRSSPGSYVAATRCSPPTGRRRASRSSASARCSSPGMPSNKRVSPKSPPTRAPRATREHAP